MGSSCSKRKRKLACRLQRARLQYNRRHGISSDSPPGRVPSLASLCVQKLASERSRLNITDINTIGSLSQQLLDQLVSVGMLDSDSLHLFSESPLWKLQLACYPGVNSAFCEALARSGKLTVVNISCTAVEDNAMQKIGQNKHLRSLNLAQTAITVNGLKYLSGLWHITSLVLDSCSGIQGSIPGLSSLRNLSHLSLSNCRHISPHDVLAALGKTTNLTHLNLSWCQRNTEQCELKDICAISNLQSLRTLLLDNAALHVEAIQGVLALPQLTKLGASGFALQLPCTVEKQRGWQSWIPGMFPVERHQSANIQHGNWSHDGNEVDREALAAVSTIRADWPSGENAHREADGAMPSMFPHVHPMSALRGLVHLSLRWSRLPQLSWTHMSCLTNLKYLDLSFTNLGNSMLPTFTALTGLTHLDVDSTAISDAGLPAVARLTSLESLCLADTKVENAGVEYLVTLYKLHTLSLAYTNITDPAVAVLKDLANLVSLSIDSRLIGDMGLQYLPALTRLESLDIFGCKMTRRSAEHIAGMKQLRWLEAAGGVLDDEGVGFLSSLSNLTYLSIAQNNSVTDSACTALMGLKELRHLNMSGTGTSVAAMAFAQSYHYLQTLSIGNLSGTRAEAEWLAELLPSVHVCGSPVDRRRVQL